MFQFNSSDNKMQSVSVCYGYWLKVKHFFYAKEKAFQS